MRAIPVQATTTILREHLLFLLLILSFGTSAAMAQVVTTTRLTTYADTVRVGAMTAELVRLSGQVFTITPVTPPNPITPPSPIVLITATTIVGAQGVGLSSANRYLAGRVSRVSGTVTLPGNFPAHSPLLVLLTPPNPITPPTRLCPPLSSVIHRCQRKGNDDRRRRGHTALGTGELVEGGRGCDRRSGTK